MEENRQDTPQQPVQTNPFAEGVASFDNEVESRFGAKVEEGSQPSSPTVEDAFTTTTEQTEVVAPAQPPQEIPQQTQPLDPKNDDRRYQYWQSAL